MFNLINLLLNFLFPPTCGFCNKLDNNFLCPTCNSKLQLEKKSSISTYQSQNFYFNKHFYLFKYENEIRSKILQYKFQEKSYLYKTFSKLFIEDECFNSFIQNYNCILSVPLSKKRYNERGYNQSALIATEISKYFKIPYYNNILIKRKDTFQQSSLNKEERKINISGAFAINLTAQPLVKKHFSLENIAIFDDIFTTRFYSKRMC